MTNKDGLDYAWKWFEYHAGQRMLAFRFFLILLAALVLAVANSVKDEQAFLVSTASLFGAFISLAFFMLEIRNEALVNVGRNALRHLEESDELLRATPILQLLHIDRQRSDLVSHKFWVRAIYLVCLASFLVVGLAPLLCLMRR